MTKIVIADDHRVVRSGLRMLLDREDGFEVVAEAGDVADARRYVRAHRPDVLILDLNMPGDPSLPAIPIFLEESPTTRVVVLTMQEDPAFAREALQAGASGYVLKEAADEELVHAVRAAADGGTYLNPQLGARIAAAPRRARRAARRPDRARGRDPAADRARPHQLRDRRPALPERAHGRVAPRAHPAEDPAHQPRRARALRARARPRRRLARRLRRSTVAHRGTPRMARPEGSA